ncbi:hypothetical protein N9N67_05240 [Bacteriovoracaceae bacterium]|nr:hypothetical protein [Bacteriovoracaceae bacterium]
MGVKKIKTEGELLSFQEELDFVVNNKCPFLMWQNDSELGERRIHPGYLTKFDGNLCSLYAEEANNNKFSFNQRDVYVFIEEAQIIFKGEVITDLNESHLTIGIPEEIKKVKAEEIVQLRDSFYQSLKNYYFKPGGFNLDNIDENYYANSNLVGHHDRQLFADELEYAALEDEDRKFASLRESPRSRPKKDKRLIVSLVDEPTFSNDCLLWDLSTGGMGFITTFPAKYEKGKQIYIRGIDGKMFDHPMIADIMSVREADQDKSEWKIGVKLKT